MNCSLYLTGFYIKSLHCLPSAQYYNVNFQSDVCICDEDECNLDCDCKYECDSVFSTPSPKEH